MQTYRITFVNCAEKKSLKRGKLCENMNMDYWLI